MRFSPRHLLVATMALTILACSSFSAPQAPARDGPARTPSAPAGDVQIQVNKDGSFTPAEVEVRAGDTVVWKLSDRERDSIVPLKSGSGPTCSNVAKWTGKSRDLTGPMPRNPSGVFVLNQDGPGFVVQGGGGKKGSGPAPALEKSGELGAVMQESWRSDENAGAFLRIRWNWLQPDRRGDYDWDVLDREVSRAVAAGKLYSIGVKAGFYGTPDWIFDEGVEKLIFRDFSSGGAYKDPCNCGAFSVLGSPTDPRFEELYFEMLEAVADHLKSNAAWYRNLAYVKPSGANLYSVENRLPKRCNCSELCPDAPCRVPKQYRDAPMLDEGGRICNSKVWAKAGFTAKGLARFYDRQLTHLASQFPEKDFAYLLIQSGFPLVTSPSDYIRCGEDELEGGPGGTEQTRDIVKAGFEKHKERFAVQHAGLQIERAPNPFLLRFKKLHPSTIVGLQTTNDVTDAALLGKALANGVNNSGATFIEIYEAAAWKAEWQGETDPSARPKRDLAAWNEVLHERRRDDAVGDGPLRDPFPAYHSFTVPSGKATYRYINPYRCKGAGSVGTLRVVP